MIQLQRLFFLIALLVLAACSPARVLAPTPNIFGNGAYPLSEIPVAYQTAQPRIFYVTDRRQTNEDGFLSYGTERSSSMAFGASTVAYGENQNWQSLGIASGSFERPNKLKLSLITVSYTHLTLPTICSV